MKSMMNSEEILKELLDLDGRAREDINDLSSFRLLRERLNDAGLVFLKNLVSYRITPLEERLKQEKKKEEFESIKRKNTKYNLKWISRYKSISTVHLSCSGYEPLCLRIKDNPWKGFDGYENINSDNGLKPCEACLKSLKKLNKIDNAMLEMVTEINRKNNSSFFIKDSYWIRGMNFYISKQDSRDLVWVWVCIDQGMAHIGFVYKGIQRLSHGYNDMFPCSGLQNGVFNSSSNEVMEKVYSHLERLDDENEKAFIEQIHSE